MSLTISRLLLDSSGRIRVKDAAAANFNGGSPVTSGGQLAASGIGDPNFSSVLWLMPGSSDFSDFSPAAKGPASVTGETINSANNLFGLPTIACGGASGQKAEVASSTFTGDFTIEGWANGGNTGGLWSSRDSANHGCIMFLNSNVSATCRVDVAGVAFSSNIAVPSTGWYHWAFTRQRSTGTCQSFIAGVLTSTWGTTANANPDGGPIWCAGNWGSAIGNNLGPYNGRLANIRVSSIRRYTATFTPPTGPFPTS